MADEKKLDFGKLNVRKKNKTTPAKPQKVYKEVEQPPAEKQEAKQIEQVERLELASEPEPEPPKKKPAPKKKATKVGRKSWKKEGVSYTRLAFDTPIDTKQKIKQLLATKFFGKFISQDEMINHAMNEFIKKHGLK